MYVNTANNNNADYLRWLFNKYNTDFNITKTC